MFSSGHNIETNAKRFLAIKEPVIDVIRSSLLGLRFDILWVRYASSIIEHTPDLPMLDSYHVSQAANLLLKAVGSELIFECVAG
jgi:hypothetical protein